MKADMQQARALKTYKYMNPILDKYFLFYWNPPQKTLAFLIKFSRVIHLLKFKV